MKIHCLDPNGINANEKQANNILEKSLPESWKGYSSLEMIGRQSNGFEADIILITADRIIVVELKNYNGNLYSRDGKWIIQSGKYEGTRTNGARQVSTAAKVLSSRINDKLKHKLSMVPWVDKCVVLCGSATNEFLPEDEQKIVFSLEEFKDIGNPKKYKEFFGEKLPYRWCTPSSNVDRPNRNIALWDKFFINNSADFKPKTFTANGYVISDKALFQHKDKIYSEYRSQRKNDRNYKALMRRWDFTAPTIRDKARTPDERELIAYRESKVLGFIDNQDETLRDVHLNLLHVPEEITSDFVELYEWPRNRLRLNEFIAKNKDKLNQIKRLDIIQVLLSHLARLHEINVAHRDIGAHSVWLSLPSGITLSNFLTASYPDPKNETVCNVREYLKHGRIDIPEDLYDDTDGTPYTRDVYLTGAVAYYIAYNSWPKKEDGIYTWEAVENDPFEGLLDNWFKIALNIEAKERFQNLSIALDEFNCLIRKNENEDGVSLEALKPYHSDINVYLEYQPLQQIHTKGTSMLFRSGDGKIGIKLWNGISETISNDEINHHLLAFLGRTQQIKSAQFDQASRIIDFGYNPSMQSLFVAYEWLDGLAWSEWIQQNESISLEDIEKIIYKLIKSTAHIHRHGFIHGDIHPKNIILKDNHPIFIDLIDFSETKQSYNPSYVPENFENLSLIARDRYAVTKIVLEAAEKRNLIHLAEYCRKLVEQPEVSEGDFNRLIDDYQTINSPPPPHKIPIFEIMARNFKEEPEEIDSDDGVYYISIKVEKNEHGGLLKLFIVGIKQQINIHINTDRKFIVRVYPPKSIRHDQFIRSKRTADIELEGKISLINGSANHADEFINIILEDKSVKEKIERLEGVKKAPSKQLLTLNTYKSDPIRDIWSVLVETEYEILPKIVITHIPEYQSDRTVLIRFSVEDSQIDFNLKTERVELKKEVDDNLRSLGVVLEIGRDLLRYTPRGRTEVQVGDILRLEGALTASSLIKRKKAVEALVNGRGVLPELPDYFDPSLKLMSNNILAEPTDDELDSYTEIDDEGVVKFKLNESQREAFKKLYSCAPLGLLQGPPGTGKTAFIGSFIHYVIEHGAKRILLVSQSHEAVNNATEKVKNLFGRKNKDIAIVRLGDEGNVSEALSDVQEIALQDYYRDKFRAEFKERIYTATESLALPKEFIDVSTRIELSLGRDIEAITRILINNELDEDVKSNAKKRINKVIEKSEKYLPKGFNLPIEIDDLSANSSIRDKIVYSLADFYDIDSPQLIEKYKNILHIATEWLSVMSSGRSQFQNFLAKTRTLVCGTCVGIGRNHYGIDENIYDLVIIDEAARATASEMAIAMQVGRKVILVGDHRQLPPQLEDNHIKVAKRKLKSTDEKELRKSDFERAFLSEYGKQVGQQLSIQYRMAPPIGDLVSYCFYKESLQTGRMDCDDVFNSLPKNLGSTVTWVDTSKDGSKAYDRRPRYKDGNQNSWENEYEANVIISLIQSLSEQSDLSKYFDPSDEPKIGVICMYSEQRRLLITKIHQLSWIRNLLEQRIIKIDTVDSYQGKENSIIITSLVRNNAREEQGFLYSENRANVALSRAKERLYIIGATRMWKNHNSDSAFGKVLSYIENQKNSEYRIIDANTWEGE